MDPIVKELIKNNIELSKKSADLVISVKELSNRISKLIDVFEGAAKVIKEEEVKEPLVEKITTLIEQNKQIAKGLLILERFIQEKSPYQVVQQKRF
ncbi:hypothetical protein HY498_01920 [Candidatus Woesearchaeota archaeon]|nr:hypothetical protein [Candidatus Woesearchaeota archaeon]